MGVCTEMPDLGWLYESGCKLLCVNGCWILTEEFLTGTICMYVLGKVSVYVYVCAYMCACVSMQRATYVAGGAQRGCAGISTHAYGVPCVSRAVLLQTHIKGSAPCQSFKAGRGLFLPSHRLSVFV